jgi:hypothetical protein
MNEVVVDIGDIPVQTPMKAIMHNVVKTSMHNPMQKVHTLNSINKRIQNAGGQGTISKNCWQHWCKTHVLFST